MLLKGKELIALTQKAKAEGWAIGAFNINDIDTTEIILDAAEQTNTPVILQTKDYFDPNAPEGGSMMSEKQSEDFMRYVRDRAEHATVPVAIHLDHCPTYAGCARAIQYGACSVMLDASMKPFDENVDLTNKVKEMCHATGTCLEAEIGHVTGHANSTGAVYTDVDTAEKFYAATGVDMLAVSIGTVHGVYASDPVLNYERIKELNAAIPAALVMHGSSGLSPEQFHDAVTAGIVKINFATYLQLTAAAAVKDYILAHKDEKLRNGTLVQVAHDAGVEYIKKHIGYFMTKPVK